MPEGDTIYKVARLLRPLLVEKPLIRVQTRAGLEREELAGQHVTRIDTRGKYLTLCLSSGGTLGCHLGIKGSWHRYAPGERWQRSPSAASLVLQTETDVLVCFRAKQVDVAGRHDPRRGRATEQLGPDLLAHELDEDEILRRARQLCHPDTTAADLLLDQRVAAGIGNVYKSEVLFLEGIVPSRPVAELEDATLRALYRQARRLMQANLQPGLRVTTAIGGQAPTPGRGRHWVYGRTGHPCHRCAHPIRQKRHTELRRATYWCPECQG
jgi:endonuclease-8